MLCGDQPHACALAITCPPAQGAFRCCWEGPQDFGVQVRMHPEVLMGEGDGVVPGQEAVARAEEALAWVLWALFAYAEEIGLKPPPFW